MNHIAHVRQDPEGDREFLQEKAMVEFGAIVATLMNSKNVSVKELAKRTGFKRKFIKNAIEAGNKEITLRQASCILWALGHELEFIMRPDQFSKF